MPSSLALYHLFGPILSETTRQGSTPADWPKRPPGPLVWLHAPRREDREIVGDMVARLSDIEPDAWFLVTGREARGSAMEEQSFTTSLPPDTRAGAAQFIAHWKPDVAVWMTDSLRPAVIAEAADSGVPIFLVDTGSALRVLARGLWGYPGLLRTTLRRFSGILSGDEATRKALIAHGADRFMVETTGVLERAIEPPPCNEAERDTLARLLAARPVWLAAEVGLDELPVVLEAHGLAARRTHRLLLIVTPGNLDQAGRFAELMASRNLTFRRRSSGAEPDPETQVYLADTEGEAGLWYRLAIATLPGGTLREGAKAGPSPFGPASLGSVVVHGPHLGAHREAYERLQRAEASVRVESGPELAGAIDSLLAPDRAAEKAHAAWQVCSAGAEVMERVLSIIGDTLKKRRAST